MKKVGFKLLFLCRNCSKIVNFFKFPVVRYCSHYAEGISSLQIHAQALEQERLGTFFPCCIGDSLLQIFYKFETIWSPWTHGFVSYRDKSGLLQMLAVMTILQRYSLDRIELKSSSQKTNLRSFPNYHSHLADLKKCAVHCKWLQTNDR